MYFQRYMCLNAYIFFLFFKKKMSILENIVTSFLKKNDIEFVTQKRFYFLGRKSLDFFLPQYNVAIECQGIQHYKEVAFFDSKKQQKRDIEKMRQCLNNNIKIVYYTSYKNKKIIPRKFKKNTFFNLRIMMNKIKNENEI